MDKKLAQQKLLMTREKFLQYQTSAQHRDAIKYLAEASEDDDVRITAKSFNCVRNMLLFCINVRNGNRAGALALMSVSDFRDRKKCCDRKSGETGIQHNGNGNHQNLR